MARSDYSQDGSCPGAGPFLRSLLTSNTSTTNTSNNIGRERLKFGTKPPIGCSKQQHVDNRTEVETAGAPSRAPPSSEAKRDLAN
jgi:hypothetical protein